MSINQVIEKIEALKEWQQLRAEAEAQEEALKDELKDFMATENVEEYEAGRYILRWTTVKSNRFDSTAFKKSHLDLYKEFTKLSTSRRFTVSG